MTNGPVLRNIRVADLGWIEPAIDSWARTRRWSVAGLTPSAQAVRDLLWRGAAQQQCVSTPDGEPVAVLQLTDLDLHNEVAELALLAHPGRADAVRDGIAAFLARAILDFPLRKVGLSVVDGELPVTDYLGLAPRPAGRLERHVRRGGDRFADVLLYEMWLDRGREVAP